MRIINPTFAQQQLATDAQKPSEGAVVDWSRDPVAIIGNAKPNARELLEGVKAMMGEFRTTENIDYLYKDSAAQPAPPGLIEQVSRNYKAAILALAD